MVTGTLRRKIGKLNAENCPWSYSSTKNSLRLCVLVDSHEFGSFLQKHSRGTWYSLPLVLANIRFPDITISFVLQQWGL